MGSEQGFFFRSYFSVTEGLEDVSKFPNLFAALIETGRWSENDLDKLAGRNMLRVLQEVESVKEKMLDVTPRQSWIKSSDLKKVGFDGACSTASLIESPPQFDLGKFVMPRRKKWLISKSSPLILNTINSKLKCHVTGHYWS